MYEICICQSIFIYKPRIVGEGGLNMGGAYIQWILLSNRDKPRSNISGMVTVRGLAVINFDGPA